MSSHGAKKTKPNVKNDQTASRSLRISSDRDDRRIFGGLKCSISGFFWVGKFWQVFSSLGSLIEVGIFLGIQNNLKISDSYTVKFRK